MPNNGTQGRAYEPLPGDERDTFEDEPSPKRDYIVVHKHAVALSLVLTLLVGLVWGFALGVSM